MGLYNWRSKLLLDLPLRMAQHDPVNTLSQNVGRAGSTLDAVFGAGAAIPTKLDYRRGYSFSGDYLDPSVAGYTITTGLITVMVTWSGAVVGATGGIFSWESAASAQVGLLLTTATDVRFYCGGVAAANACNATRAAWPIEQLNTIIGVHDGTDTIMYINGERTGVAATPLPPASASHPIRVGQRTNGASGYQGNIYHVGMADFALSPHQCSQYHREQMKRLHQI